MMRTFICTSCGAVFATKERYDDLVKCPKCKCRALVHGVKKP